MGLREAILLSLSFSSMKWGVVYHLSCEFVRIKDTLYAEELLVHSKYPIKDSQHFPALFPIPSLLPGQS